MDIKKNMNYQSFGSNVVVKFEKDMEFDALNAMRFAIGKGLVKIEHSCASIVNDMPDTIIIGDTETALGKDFSNLMHLYVDEGLGITQRIARKILKSRETKILNFPGDCEPDLLKKVMEKHSCPLPPWAKAMGLQPALPERILNIFQRSK